MMSFPSLLSTFLKRLLTRDDFVMNRTTDHHYPTGEPIKRAYWNCLCTGRVTSSVEETETAFTDWRNILKSAKAAARWQRSLSLGQCGGLSTYTSWFVGDIKSRTPESEVLEATMKPSFNRRLAWTRQGYLALVPAETQPGATVSYLKGGRLPFLLRSQGDSWKMIGPCYVHEMMGGELYNNDAVSVVRLG